MLTSCGYVRLLPLVILCAHIRHIFPSWSSQMTILRATSAIKHIKYESGRYKFKYKKSTDWLPWNNHQHHQPTRKTPGPIWRNSLDGIHLGGSQGIHSGLLVGLKSGGGGGGLRPGLDLFNKTRCRWVIFLPTLLLILIFLPFVLV